MDSPPPGQGQDHPERQEAAAAAAAARAMPAEDVTTLRTLAAYQAHWLTERPRTETSMEEEAGTQLRLGEFEGVPTLSVSEARLLIEVLHGKRAREGRKTLDTEITHKMITYCDMFARFRNHDQITAVEHLLDRLPQLSYFERSQLTSLCPGDFEEAMALIPSLQNKVSDDELEQLVHDIADSRTL